MPSAAARTFFATPSGALKSSALRGRVLLALLLCGPPPMYHDCPSFQGSPSIAEPSP
jgi:hypothetical protein